MTLTVSYACIYLEVSLRLRVVDILISIHQAEIYI
jgi:hypothetical protein